MEKERITLDKYSGKDQLDSFGVPIGDTERVLSVALHPTKPYLAFGCENSTLKLWNIRSKMFVTVACHPGQIHCVSFSHTGHYQCSGSSKGPNGNTLYVWECVFDVKNEEDISLKLVLSDEMLSLDRSDVLHQDVITCCSFMAPRNIKDNPSILASSSRDGTVRVWSFPLGYVMTRQTLHKHVAPVRCLEFSSDGKFLISGDESGKLGIFRITEQASLENQSDELKKKKKKAEKKEDDGEIYSLGIAPNIGFTHVFTHNVGEPVFSLKISYDYLLTTQSNVNKKARQVDRRYQVAVGTSKSVALYKLEDGTTPFNNSFEATLNAVHVIESGKNVVNDDGFNAKQRSINLATLTMMWRQETEYPATAVTFSTLTFPKNKDVPKEHMQGTLKCKSATKIFGKTLWDTKYWRLNVLTGILSWHENKDAYAPSGIIRLSSVKKSKLQNQDDYPGRFVMKFRGGKSRYEMKAPSSQEAEDWVESLTSAKDNSRPETLMVCVGCGNEVRVYVLGVMVDTVSNPDPSLQKAMNLVPHFVEQSMTVVGTCQDRITSVALPSNQVRERFIDAHILNEQQYYLAVGSIDQSVKLLSWEVGVIPETEEVEETITEAEYKEMLNKSSDIRKKQFHNTMDVEPYMMLDEASCKIWTKLERPLTQHQLTMRVQEKVDLALNSGINLTPAPVSYFLGMPGVHTVDAQKLYNVSDDEEYQEQLRGGGSKNKADDATKVDENSQGEDDEDDEAFDIASLNIIEEEDVYAAMEDATRVLLGGVNPQNSSQVAKMAQVDERVAPATRAEILLRNAEQNKMIYAESDEEPEEPVNEGHVVDLAEEGQLATFTRIMESENARIESERTCKMIDCPLM